MRAVSLSSLSVVVTKIGVTGFEPATTRPPDVYATWLRHTPRLEL